jgi:hypothetical protein
MNPLYDMMKNNGLPPIVQQFMQFKQNYNGDARAQIQQMLSSGKISQADYDRAVQMAQQLQQMLSMGGRH